PSASTFYAIVRNLLHRENPPWENMPTPQLANGALTAARCKAPSRPPTRTFPRRGPEPLLQRQRACLKISSRLPQIAELALGAFRRFGGTVANNAHTAVNDDGCCPSRCVTEKACRTGRERPNVRDLRLVAGRLVLDSRDVHRFFLGALQVVVP